MSDGKKSNSYVEFVEEYIKKDRSPILIGEIKYIDEPVMAHLSAIKIKPVLDRSHCNESFGVFERLKRFLRCHGVQAGMCMNNRKAKRMKEMIKEQDRKLNYIEPGILPVCDALNGVHGIETLFSCEGHPSRPYHTPYVMFRAPTTCAFKIHKSLSHGHGIDWRLKFCWCLVATFDEDGTLKYTLETNDARLSRWPEFHILPSWKRSEMDIELIKLASLICECF